MTPAELWADFSNFTPVEEYLALVQESGLSIEEAVREDVARVAENHDLPEGMTQESEIATLVEFLKGQALTKITAGMTFTKRQIGMEGPWTVENVAAGRAIMRKAGASWTMIVPVCALRDKYGGWTLKTN